MIKDLTVGNPSKVLWQFSLPLFFSIIFQQLYNIADSFVAGQFIGENALAAVGNAYEVTLIYLAFAFGCNIGASVVISKFFGAKRMKDIKTAVSTIFVASTVLCIVLSLIGFLAMPFLLRLINTPDVIFADTILYLKIYTAGLVFLFIYNISNGIFSALGDSKTPFYFLAVSSISNIFLDILFVKSFHMGVMGVALATFLCQMVSAVAVLLILIKRLKTIKTDGKPIFFSTSMLKTIVKIAVPSTLQQSFISVGNILIQSVINSYGPSVIAGYSASIKLNSFAVTSFSTLGNGVSNFTAQNIGAGQLDRVKKGYKSGLVMVFCTCAIFITAYLLFGKDLVGLFSKNNTGDAIAVGQQFLQIVSPFYFIVATKLVTDGVLRGASMMTQFMATTFVDLVIRVVLAFVLSSCLGVVGIWLSWPIGWTISTALSLIFYFKGKWQKKCI